MKDGINSKGMKYSNALLVLETIMKKAPISRSELTKLVGLTQVSVINITNMFLEAGIICEVGRANAVNQGRKAMVLDVNAEAFYSIGIELSTGKVGCGLADARGELVRFAELDFPTCYTAEQMIDLVEKVIEEFLKEFQIDRKRVLGVGIGAPGPLDVEDGRIINPPNFPTWENVPIRAMMEKRLGFRVCIDKETNLAALAENFYGLSAAYKTSFFMSLFRLGIGGGLVADGNIFHGFRDGAGEVGHVLVDSTGPQCGCGSYGCLEAMIAEDYVLEQTRRMYKMGIEPGCPEHIDKLTLEELFERSEQGDPVCEFSVKKMASYISISVGNIVNTFSPQLIILGGPLTELSNQLVDMVSERVHQRKYPSHCPDVKIEKSSLGSRVYVKGAIALVLKSFLPYVLPESF